MKRAVTFYYNEETGELAKVDWSDRFKNADSLMKADVLGDIKEEIEEHYGDSVADFCEELLEMGASPDGVTCAMEQLGHE